MYDNGVGVLSQYGLTAITTCKGRGAMLCETETGWKSIQEFGGARNKLELQCQLQEQLMRSGAVQTDCPLRNETGELVSQGVLCGQGMASRKGMRYAQHSGDPKSCVRNGAST